MFVAKSAMTSVHPRTMTARMYKKLESTHSKLNVVDRLKNFPENIDNIAISRAKK